jgi:hypothetical protein
MNDKLQQVRTDAAKVVYALDCAVQLIEVLIAWKIPEETVLPEGVAACQHRLIEALRELRR